jgi:ABC-type multidrug transport system ATPase subunit
MFAGPNGSGKSTLKSVLPQELLGVYLNPDEIEQTIRRKMFVDLESYGVLLTKEDVLPFFTQSRLLREAAWWLYGIRAARTFSTTLRVNKTARG